MRRFVALVICAGCVVPAAVAAQPTRVLLRKAQRASGLQAQRAIPTVREPPARFDADAVGALDREYPPSLQATDARLYAGLGLLADGDSLRPKLVADATTAGAMYDARARVLRVRTRPAPTRAELLNEVVLALVDQNVGLSRLTNLRPKNRDAALAANGMVEGLAASASGRRPPALHGAPIERFLSLERSAGSGVGRALVAQLRSVGGNIAVVSALRALPQTTEQLLHVDKLLQRERALPVALPARVDDRAVSTTETLTASETFGELDVRALLQAFALSGATRGATGWGGGKLALYTGKDGAETVALVLRWDSSEDAAEWHALVGAYVAAAFAGTQPRVCPAVDHCWLAGTREIASATVGTTSVLAGGPAGELVAATLARANAGS